jgi:FtsX-like permease family
MLAGCEIRRRWRSVAVLALLVGVVGAVVLATVAGARRSDSALARFNASSRTGNIEMFVGQATAAQLRAFRGAEGVDSFARLRGEALTFARAPNLRAIGGALDTAFGTVVDRPRIVAGRAADPSAVDEVAIGETLAAQLHLRVGDHLDGESYTPKQVLGFLTGTFTGGPVGPGGQPIGAGPRFRLRIVGIARRPLDLGDRGAAGGVFVLTPAFTRKYEHSIGTFQGTILRVRTRHGAADVPQVAAAARRIFDRSPQFQFQDLAVDTQGPQNAIDVLVVALWVFAGVAALAGVVAITIVLSREISLTAVDQGTQRALGLTRSQRIAVGVLQTVPVAVSGAVVAVVGAAVASPLFPIGVARRAEPDPGLRIDGTVLALGTVAVIAGLLVLAFLAALHTTQRQRGAERSGVGRTAAVVAAASRSGLTPVATTGVRMALEPGRGPTTVPVRSAIFGAVFGVVGVVAVLMFASSLDHLVATPGLYGWRWDFAAVVDDPSLFGPTKGLAHEPGLAAAARVETLNVQLDGRPVIAWGYTPLHGTISPEIITGHPPTGPDEIALGTATLDELNKTIGDRVHGQGQDGSHTYRIVATAAFPKLDTPQPLANGAALTGTGLAHLVSPTDTTNPSLYLLGRIAPGAKLATVEHRVAAVARFGVERPFGTSVPVEVDRLQQVNWLPATLALLLAMLALLAVGHGLVTSVRRHRRELAILKTLGFNRHQIRATIEWQATTLATLGLIAGIPAGLIIGNLVWRHVADNVGVSTTSQIPTVALLLTIVCALTAVNLIAYFPARAAAQTRPAVALRSE